MKYIVDDVFETDFSDDFVLEPPRKQMCFNSRSLTSEIFSQHVHDLGKGVERRATLERKDPFSLQTLKRCVVIDVSEVKKGKILQLQAPGTEKCTSCLVMGMWGQLEYKVNDVVNIQACKSQEEAYEWQIDYTNGFLVYCPDILITPSSIMSSYPCIRKSVLSSKFRDDGLSEVAAVGMLVHKLLQKSITLGLSCESDVTESALDILSSPQSKICLYSSGLTMSAAKEKLLSFVPNIKKFMKDFVCFNGRITRRDSEASKSCWDGAICGVKDIEETVMDPKLGLHGKIDITVEVTKCVGGGVFGKYVLPLELKTGRPSYSVQHWGQVALYSLMKETSSGLLLYLKDVTMQEKVTRDVDRNGLIQRRNEIIYHKNKLTDASSESNGGDKRFLSQSFPPPVLDKRSCEYCHVKTVCGAFLRHSMPPGSISNDFPPLASSSHLTEKELEYFIDMIVCLQLEEYDNKSVGSNLTDLWLVPAVEREAKGSCISNLTVSTVQPGHDGTFIHTFTRLSDNSKSAVDNFTTTAFESDSWVYVSTDEKFGFAQGSIRKVLEKFICVVLDRDLRKQPHGNMYHIDIKHFDQSNSCLWSNLRELICDNLSAKRLRNILIDQSTPKPIQEGLQMYRAILPLIAGLNDDQVKAIYNVLFSRDYTVVHGKPGTGKTMFIVVLVQVLVALNRSVLIASHTHAAVDKILLALQKKNVNFLRVGKKSRISQDIDSDSVSSSIEESALTSDDMNRLFNEELVVASTCLGTKHFLFKDRVFDYCLLDEASQISQLEAVRPLMLCKKFVLVGDMKQLPPLVISRRATKLGMSESILERLSKRSGSASKELNCQYRMNRTVMNLANRFAYDGKLVCGALNELGTLKARNWGILEENAGDNLWLLKVLSMKLEDAVVALDTGDVSHVQGQDHRLPELQDRLLKTVNLAEAAVVYFVVSGLRVIGVKAEDVGVIAPYQQQVSLLKKVFAAKSSYHGSVSVNTIDQYQGQEKSVVIISCTRSSPNKTTESKNGSILDDMKRMTVAITRSKHKLILIGNVQVLKTHFAVMNKLFSFIDEKSTLSCKNFDWSYMIRKTLKHLGGCES